MNFNQPIRPRAMLANNQFGPVTAAEMAVAAARADKTLPLSHWCHPTEVNDYTQRSHMWENRQIIREVKRLERIRACDTARMNRNISGRVEVYLRALKEKGVPYVIVRMKMGHEISLLNPNNTIDSLNDISRNPNYAAFYQQHIMPIVRHLFNWVIDEFSVVKPMRTFNARVGVFEKGFKSGRRITYPMWSNAFLTQQTDNLTPIDARVCSGHMLEAVQFMDRHMHGLLLQIQSQQRNPGVFVVAHENYDYEAAWSPNRYWRDGRH